MSVWGPSRAGGCRQGCGVQVGMWGTGCRQCYRVQTALWGADIVMGCRGGRGQAGLWGMRCRQRYGV